MAPKTASTRYAGGTRSIVLRWMCVVPAVSAVAVLAYGMASMTSRISADLFSELVNVVVFAAAGYIAVFVARSIAPAAKRATGGAVATMIALASCYEIGERVGLSRPDGVVSAVWYAIALNAVLVLGALIGTLVNGDNEDFEELRPALALRVRWVAFLPVAILAALAVIVLAAYYVGMFLPAALGVVSIEAQFLSILVFISLATAIAPRYRRIVVALVSAPWLIGAGIILAEGLLRPVLLPWIESITYIGVRFEYPAWLQSLQGLAWLAATVIPVVVTFRASQPRPHLAS